MRRLCSLESNAASFSTMFRGQADSILSLYFSSFICQLQAQSFMQVTGFCIVMTLSTFYFAILVPNLHRESETPNGRIAEFTALTSRLALTRREV